MNALLSMGLSGSAAFLIWAAFNRMFGERLPAAWHTAILRFALFLTLVPVTRFHALLSGYPYSITPVATTQAVSETLSAIMPVTEIFVQERPLLSLSAAALRALAALWTAGSVVMISLRLRDYIFGVNGLQSIRRSGIIRRKTHDKGEHLWKTKC